MKLAGKFILIFILAVIAVTAVSSHFTSKQFFESVEDRHEEMTDVMRNQAEFQYAIETGDPIHIRKCVQTVTDESLQVRWVWFEQTTSREFQPAVDDARSISASAQAWPEAISAIAVTAAVARRRAAARAS